MSEHIELYNQQSHIIYSDINPDSPFDQPLLENVNSVIMSLANIFSTDYKERFFNLDITAGLSDLLFEVMTDELSALIYSKIVRAIEKHEPRVKVINEKSFVIPVYDENRYYCIFEFYIHGFYGTYNFKFSLPRRS